MREEMSGLRHRWHGFLRRRLERLRGRIDRRIARLEEKEQHLRGTPATPAGEAPKPPARTRTRRRAARTQRSGG